MSHRIYALLRRLAPPDDPSSDAALLLRFARQRDETAFELLVWRHGGLVLGVCRRVLRDEHLAEDAFQATFLILARKAASVRGSLAGWLHQVARRVCLRALRRNPVPLETGGEVGTTSPDPWLSAELRSVLDEEVARLPEKQRLAVLLCYLQGRTTDDAAKLLGIPRGTVLSRLDAARKRLQAALTRRGVAVPVTLFATGFASPELSADVCRRATAVAFETSIDAASIPTQLAHEVMHMSARKTVLGVAAVLVLTAGVGTGVGLVMAQGGKTPPTGAEVVKPDDKKAEPKPQPAEKSEGDKRREQRAERSDRLAKWQSEVTGQIVMLEKQRLVAVTNAGADVDPNALQVKLGVIDNAIIELEDETASRPDRIRSLEKTLEEVKSGRFLNEPWAVDGMTRMVNSAKEVAEANNLLNKRHQDVSELSKKTSPDSELLKEAQKLVKAATADLEKAREQVRPKAETDFKNVQVKTAESNLTAQKETLKQQTAHLKSLRAKRIELVTRIQKAKSAQNAQQLIDDEIQVLREIRKQVLRDRLMLEMGLEDRNK